MDAWAPNEINISPCGHEKLLGISVLWALILTLTGYNSIMIYIGVEKGKQWQSSLLVIHINTNLCLTWISKICILLQRMRFGVQWDPNDVIPLHPSGLSLSVFTLVKNLGDNFFSAKTNICWTGFPLSCQGGWVWTGTQSHHVFKGNKTLDLPLKCWKIAGGNQGRPTRAPAPACRLKSGFLSVRWLNCMDLGNPTIWALAVISWMNILIPYTLAPQPTSSLGTSASSDKERHKLGMGGRSEVRAVWGGK